MRNPQRACLALLLLLCAFPPAARPWPWARRRPPRVITILQCEGDTWTPLTCAASQGRPRIVKEYLDRGVPVNQPDAIGATALHWAALRRRDDVVQILLNRRAAVNARNRSQGTPLHWAAKSGDPKTAGLLIAHGAQLDALNSIGQTPLMLAASYGNSAVAQVLIDRGAQLGLKDSRGQGAWDLAISAGHADIARLIMQRGRGQIVAAAPARAPGAAAAAPAGSVSHAEMERLIAEAVKKATAQAAAPAAQGSDVDKPRYKLAENPDNFALVIGIERYSDIPEAQFAERDAAAVRDHLVALGYPERNIVSLLGPKATKSGITKNLETWLPNNVSEKSTVFVYYSGHGAPDPKTGQSYLVPWDGDPAFLQDTAYPTKRLYEKLNGLKAKRVIVALDSCFSGAGGRSVLAKGLRPLVTKVSTDLTAGKTVALSAAGNDQVSGTLQAQGHGLFTYYLLRGLNGEAKDAKGAVTVASLYDYLFKRVQDAARRDNGDQTPQLQPKGAQAGLRLR